VAGLSQSNQQSLWQKMYASAPARNKETKAGGPKNGEKALGLKKVYTDLR